MESFSFDTTEPSQIKGLNGWTVDPILTVGDKVNNYAMPGIPDGIGAYSLNDTTVRLLLPFRNKSIGIQPLKSLSSKDLSLIILSQEGSSCQWVI